MAVATSSSIVDWIVGCSAYLLSCGQRCCSNQLNIFIGAGLICAAATEPCPFYIQRRGSLQHYRTTCTTFALWLQFNTCCLQINTAHDVCRGEQDEGKECKKGRKGWSEVEGSIIRTEASGFKDSTALFSAARLLSQGVIMPLWQQQRNAQPATRPTSQVA